MKKTAKLRKILIAEDDPFLVKIASNRLREEGFEVDTAGNGAEALEKISKNHYSVVLLDLIMPMKDGFEVLRVLRQKKDKTPVLIFSNLAQDEDKEEVKRLGAKGYYVKSDIAIDEVVKAVKNFLK
ncbi:response regulator [Candidatus Peregrinibacteria bacterium]|nr:response regulator [Candidatus Peregrinibacteria bacterium]